MEWAAGGARRGGACLEGLTVEWMTWGSRASSEGEAGAMAQINYNANNPGPGAYYLNYKQVWGEAPKPSFGVRTEVWADKARPGPGAYNVRSELGHSPKYTMRKQYKGPAETGAQGPGPGAHHVNLKQTHWRAAAFTAQGKSPYNPDWGVPGPGAYRPQMLDHRVGRKLNARLSTTPGHYSPDSPRAAAPAHTIAHHLRQPQSTTPGVGRYNLRSAMLHGPMFSLGKRFYRLHELPLQRRYSSALQARPNYRHGLVGPHVSNTRGGTLSPAWAPSALLTARCLFSARSPRLPLRLQWR